VRIKTRDGTQAMRKVSIGWILQRRVSKGGVAHSQARVSHESAGDAGNSPTGRVPGTEPKNSAHSARRRPRSVPEPTRVQPPAPRRVREERRCGGTRATPWHPTAAGNHSPPAWLCRHARCRSGGRGPDDIHRQRRQGVRRTERGRVRRATGATSKRTRRTSTSRQCSCRAARTGPSLATASR
jgi:hypothetical protein